MRQGLLVRLKRVEKEYKTTEFAKMLGVTREYVRLIENGKAKNPSVEIMKKIAEILETSVLELFFYND